MDRLKLLINEKKYIIDGLIKKILENTWEIVYNPEGSIV